MLRKLQVYATQLFWFKERNGTEDGKLKMDTLMDMIGVFVKEKLSKEDNDHFLRYRNIQCSKIHDLIFEPGAGDCSKLMQKE